jgi:tetratricopeptide (TPR) repeat protein
MKGFSVFAILSFLAACSSNQPQPISNANVPLRAERLQNSTAHTTENQPPANSNSGSKWTQSGDPIDTAKFDKTIADAEKALKAAAVEDDAQKALAQAYFERGFALTQARQYASAIGDYRRALKYDPDHAESKEWIDQIVSIYAMLKKQPPKEGEEPKPLPWKKPVSR